jgi:hypothetical protein
MSVLLIKSKLENLFLKNQRQTFETLKSIKKPLEIKKN